MYPIMIFLVQKENKHRADMTNKIMPTHGGTPTPCKGATGGGSDDPKDRDDGDTKCRIVTGRARPIEEKKVDKRVFLSSDKLMHRSVSQYYLTTSV